MLAESGRQQAISDYADKPAAIDLVEDNTIPDVTPDTPFEEAKVNVTITKPEAPVPALSQPAMPVVQPSVKIPLAKVLAPKAAPTTTTTVDKPTDTGKSDKVDTEPSKSTKPVLESA